MMIPPYRERNILDRDERFDRMVPPRYREPLNIIPPPTPKPFRFLKPTPRRLTTVFAIGCRGGIILASDTQYTGRILEKGRKTWELRDNVIMGCAGANTYNYLFWRRLRDEFDKHEKRGPKVTLPDIIDRGIGAYNAEIRSRREDITDPEQRKEFDYYCRSQAVIAAYDEGLDAFTLFTVSLPHACDELQDPQNLRAATGSGGDPATVFLKTLEDMMESVGLHYSNFSWRTVAQLSVILLNRVSQIDPNTSGTMILRLRKHDYDVLKEKDIFPNGRFRLSQFSENVIKEVGRERVFKLLDDWKMNDVLRKFLTGGSS